MVVDLTSPSGDLTPIRSGDQIIVVRRRKGFFDILVPASSVVAAVAAVVSVAVQLNR
jgi:hypothetical protein